MEGPAFGNYNPTPAIKLGAESTNQRPKQSKRKKYKPPKSNKASKRRVLIDDSLMESETESDEIEEFEQHKLIPELIELQ